MDTNTSINDNTVKDNIQSKKDKIINLVILLIYTICIIIIASRHGLYIDESQAWLIAKNLKLPEIVEQMKYEGHSYFWHFLLYPFIHSGFTLFQTRIISVISCVISAIIILKRAPFKRYLKVLILFSPAMLFYYSAFLRPYCIIPPCLFAIASIYPDRKKHPYLMALLIGILANTHVIIMPIVGMLVLYYWFDIFIFDFKKIDNKARINYILSFIIVGVLIINVLIFLFLGLFNCRIVEVHTFSWEDIKMTLYTIFIEIFYFPVYLNCGTLTGIIVFEFVFLSLYIVKFDIKYGIIYLLQLTYMILAQSIFWFQTAIRAFLIIPILVFWIWLNKENAKEKLITTDKGINLLEIVLTLLLVVLIFTNSKFIIESLYKDTCLATETTNYIKENIPKDSVIAYVNVDYQQPLYLYLEGEYPIYKVIEGNYSSYTIWNDNYKETLDLDECTKALEKLKQEYNHVYVMGFERCFMYGEPLTKDMIYENINEDVSELKKYYSLKDVYISPKENVIEDYYIYDQVAYYILEYNGVKK